MFLLDGRKQWASLSARVASFTRERVLFDARDRDSLPRKGIVHAKQDIDAAVHDFLLGRAGPTNSPDL